MILHLCLCAMQDDDAVNAEAFINKASFLVSNSQHEVLNLQYKVCVFNNHDYAKFPCKESSLSAYFACLFVRFVMPGF